jgi:CheY-like chemotaxis protein
MQKILLIDDDSNSLSLYQSILTEAGYNITTRSDGESSLTEIQKNSYDLILHDIMLPKMDGLAVLSQIKANPPSHPVRIVMLSNLTHTPVLNEATSLGAAGFIDKATTNPTEFLERVKSYLSS